MKWTCHMAAACMMLVASVTYAGEGPSFDPRSLFEPPVALLDADGQPLVTGKALGSPYAADFDGDGVIDLIIGAHKSMDTMEGGIWLVRNVGTNAKPRFDWKSAWEVQLADGQACTLDCGCKSAGYVPVQAVDWNGDGWMDLVYTDTYRRSYVLINKKVSREKPVFERVKYFDFENTSHGMWAGGGDWNGDGVRDFLHMPHGGLFYKVLAGSTLEGKGLRFADGPYQKAQVLKIEGEKACDCAWAWNFSGKCKPGDIEYVGISGLESQDVNFYKVEGGVSRKVGTLATFPGHQVKVTACDLNGDGCMDVLYSGGVFEDPAVTKVYVMYGKVKNAAGSQPSGKPRESAASQTGK